MEIKGYRLPMVVGMVPILQATPATRTIVFMTEKDDAEFTLSSDGGVRKTLRVRTSEPRTPPKTLPGEWR